MPTVSEAYTDMLARFETRFTRVINPKVAQATIKDSRIILENHEANDGIILRVALDKTSCDKLGGENKLIVMKTTAGDEVFMIEVKGGVCFDCESFSSMLNHADFTIYLCERDIAAGYHMAILDVLIYATN